MNKKTYRMGLLIFFILLFYFSVNISFMSDELDFKVYINYMNEFRKYGFIEGYNKSYLCDYPSFSLLIFFASFFPNRVLSGISAVIFYGIVVYLLDKLDMDNEFYEFIIILFVMISLDYVSVINGVRNMLCNIFIALSLYLYYRKNKFWVIPYAISLGMHSFSLIFLVFIIILKFFDKNHYKFYFFAFVLLVMLKSNLWIIKDLIDIPYVGSIFLRLNVYLQGNFDTNAIIIFVISIYLCGLFLNSLCSEKENFFNLTNEMPKIVLIFIGFSLLFSETIFKRVLMFYPFLILSSVFNYDTMFLYTNKCKRNLLILIFTYFILEFSMLCYTTYFMIY